MYRSLLVPLDGSDHAAHALAVAVQMLDDNASLYVINVPEPPLATDRLGASVGAAPLDHPPEMARAQAEQIIQESLAKAGLSQDRVPAVVRGRPAVEAILEEARTLDIDAIIMGSRGLSDLHGLFVGSVSHKVSHLASCPVITVHLPNKT